MTETTQRTGCLAHILRLAGIKPAGESLPSPDESLPYRTRDNFLSPAELSFYHVLLSLIWREAVVCPKVRLADVFFVARPEENLRYYNRIVQKHLDFLVCEPRTMRPLVGIELDDASHRRTDRGERDLYVERVFEAAGLPLVRIPVRVGYTRDELVKALGPHLAKVDKGSVGLEEATVAPDEEASTVPICPKCGVPMVLRTASRGERQGQQFYGCRNYPNCREVRPLR